MGFEVLLLELYEKAKIEEELKMKRRENIVTIEKIETFLKAFIESECVT